MTDLLALHRPVPYTWTEWAPDAPEDDPGTDHTIQVCEECRRVEVSDAVHWSEAGEPNASRWPCRTAQLRGTNG